MDGVRANAHTDILHQRIQCVAQLACSCDSGLQDRMDNVREYSQLPGYQPHSLQRHCWPCSVYLQVPVVDRAAAVSGLRCVLAGVEQSTQLTVEAGLWHDKLHAC